eukprot:TRINITY_DN2484_c0_g2_i1.p1 TRINITY_DN2484_c0_g2~~TRINITY_DN2484_c0_g2_i1.p1  ORF type:complete len:442 (-),score=100.74 TRINITY_DN2484_c0_g2_i1:8-1333(-)
MSSGRRPVSVPAALNDFVVGAERTPRNVNKSANTASKRTTPDADVEASTLEPIVSKKYRNLPPSTDVTVMTRPALKDELTRRGVSFKANDKRDVLAAAVTASRAKDARGPVAASPPAPSESLSRHAPPLTAEQMANLAHSDDLLREIMSDDQDNPLEHGSNDDMHETTSTSSTHTTTATNTSTNTSTTTTTTTSTLPPSPVTTGTSDRPHEVDDDLPLEVIFKKLTKTLMTTYHNDEDKVLQRLVQMCIDARSEHAPTSSSSSSSSSFSPDIPHTSQKHVLLPKQFKTSKSLYILPDQLSDLFSVGRREVHHHECYDANIQAEYVRATYGTIDTGNSSVDHAVHTALVNKLKEGAQREIGNIKHPKTGFVSTIQKLVGAMPHDRIQTLADQMKADYHTVLLDLVQNGSCKASSGKGDRTLYSSARNQARDWGVGEARRARE